MRCLQETHVVSLSGMGRVESLQVAVVSVCYILPITPIDLIRVETVQGVVGISTVQCALNMYTHRYRASGM